MSFKYKNSLIVMKAYPFTKGHQYLIDTAISQSEIIHVIITHNSLQSIPGEVRFNAIKETYKRNGNVRVYSVSDEGLPQYDHECETLDEFYSYWVPLVYSKVKELDVVFTSENYGDDFAHYLGVQHVLVDKERVKVPISGTLVRSNPFKHWDFIPDEMKPHFVKRIVIMGPESCGKSTLTKRLSEYFETNFVEEYGRTVFEENNFQLSVYDFITISKGRQNIEDKMIKFSNKVIFCDTEDITTYIFSKKFYPKDYIEVEDYFQDSFDTKSKYDIYILLSPDCEAVQDGTRQFLDDRFEHYNAIKGELVKRNCNFVEIGGDWNNRFEKSKKLVQDIIYTL